MLVVLTLFIFINNTSHLAAPREGPPFLLAHRGLHQTFSMEGITGETCTAQRIFEPEHPYLENTLASIEAAFAAGADMVEFDIRPTQDGQFAVFHDWTLDCRTEATGLPSDYTMAELRQLDIGYGYTHDGGNTYPFRGHGVGQMPAMDEVLSRFPERRFLIHMKSNDPAEGVQLAQALAPLPATQRSLLTVYGANEPVQAFRELLPDVRVLSRATLEACLLPYIAIGWTGYVPAACHGAQLHIPESIAPWLWGWPNKLLNRMDAVDTRLIILAGSAAGGWSEGFDHIDDLQRLPPNFTGGIWTNRVERIAPVYGHAPLKEPAEDSASEQSASY